MHFKYTPSDCIYDIDPCIRHTARLYILLHPSYTPSSRVDKVVSGEGCCKMEGIVYV